MKINVMQIVHDLNFGGMQRVVVDLCLNVEPSKFRMSVCCLDELGPNIKELEQRGISVFLIKKGPGLDYMLPFKLRRLFLKQKIDIVHTHGINPFFYGTIGSKLAICPATIQTDHARGVFPVKNKEMFSEMILSWFVDHIVTVSEGVKSDLVKYMRINPDKISIIYNGIDASKFRIKIDKMQKRKGLGISKEDTVIGIGVRLSEQKGVCFLIEAVSILIESFPKIKLLVIGDGELKSDLEKLTEELKITNKVIFAGFRSDIHELLQIIDIYVLPSLWEGHPLVLIEAMAAEMPIVATDIPGNRETVEHGHTGFLVPQKNPQALANALMKFIENEDLRKSAGLNGYNKFRNEFTLDLMIKKYQDLYRKLTVQ
jgi:glycosyltransferase involved in cell wall biosynthesis